MSSHREAPGIANDPVADNTDVYLFVSPDKPDMVTILANFVPFEDPAGGPNFFEFGDDVLYEIHIDNTGDGRPDISYQFRFNTEYTIPGSFLYNVGPIESLDSKNWNRRQFATVTRRDGRRGHDQRLGSHLACPPCNIGPLSTPDYASLANEAIHPLPGDRTVFTGQRADGFYVDVGSIFDLGTVRPFQNLHFGSDLPASPGVNGLKAKNVHTIALQVPMSDLTSGGHRPTDPADRGSTIGVFASASRQRTRMYDHVGAIQNHGPFVQVSRLANPLFNEVLIPITKKDYFNSQPPAKDEQFARYVARPELSQLLPSLYPGVFPHLQNLNRSGKPRADLLAIFLTGIPAGLVPGFQNYTGDHQSEQMRLNLAIPPTRGTPNNLGLLGGDLAGFPNGRRVFDDVVTIELRALAGVTYALVDKGFTPDAAATVVNQGLTASDTDLTAKGTVHFLSSFPYLGIPHSGYYNPVDDTPAPLPPQ